MKKLFSIIMFVLLLVWAAMFLIAPGPVFAQLGMLEDGTRLSGIAGEINWTGDVDISGTGLRKVVNIGQSARTIEAVADSTDTVVVADDGKIFVYSTADDTTIILPDAVAGLYYTFIKINNIEGTSPTLSLDPATTDDTIVYLNLSGGEKLTSSGATGDMATIIGAANTWYVIEMGAVAWSNGG